MLYFVLLQDFKNVVQYDKEEGLFKQLQILSYCLCFMLFPIIVQDFFLFKATLGYT